MALKSFFSDIFSGGHQADAVIAARNPEPRDKGMPSLTDFPDEIISRILIFIQDVSPRTVFDIALVNSHMYHWARYIQYRHVSIDLGKTSTRNILDFISRNGLAPALHTLHVVSRPNDLDSPTLSVLGETIMAMTGLRDIHWSGSAIPEQVLERLKHHPQARLHTKVDIITSRHLGNQFLEGLPNCPNLFSVDADVTYTGAKEVIKAMQRLKQILLSCPNVRRLSLDIHQPRQGCVVYGPSTDYCGLGLSQDEHPPPLEELSIVNYPWGCEKKENTFFNCVGYPEKGTEMDYWADRWDWSQLRKLHDASFTFAPKIAPKLTALKHIAIGTARSSNTNTACIAQFFDELPATLESITIPKLASVGIAAILRHGASLRQLYIHQQEGRNWSSDAVTNEDLIQLRDRLPYLKELSIDIRRYQDNWPPYDTLDILSGFPQLRTLTLWFELGVHDRENPLEPFITATSASELFSYLHKRTLTHPVCLQRLYVCSGAPAPLGNGLFSSQVYWPEQNSTSFLCQLAERDDEAAGGVFNITCPKLTRELNEKMNHIVRGEEGQWLPETGRGRIPFQVALNGPMLVGDWLDWYNQEQTMAFQASRQRPPKYKRVFRLK